MRMKWILVGLFAGAMEVGCGVSSPPMPVLGQVVDRAGRPFASEALAAPFALGDEHAAAAVRWKTGTFAERVEMLLPVLGAYDGLDGECGNQRAAGPAGPARYRPFAEILAEDRLLIDTSVGVCERLLAVEIGAVDCGGFAPTLDVPEVLLSELVSGVAAGVTDGVDRDPDGAPSVSEFPFLLDPTH